MIRRNIIGMASAVVMLAATGCGDSDDTNGTDKDSGVQDLDSGSGRQDASVRLDAASESDAGSSQDAGIDAEVELDADVDAEVELDAALDASGTELDGGADAEVDAAVDSGTPDASLPALAAHYAFDENMGTAAADTAGEFADGTLVGGAQWVTGFNGSGSAVDLAGGPGNEAHQHVTLPANILDGCDDITVALWMRLGAVPYNTRLLDIDGTVNGFLFFTPTQYVGGAPGLNFNIYHPPGEGPSDQGVVAAYPSGTVLIDTWHHVAFTLSAGTGRLYFDGVQIGSNPMALKPSDLDYAAGAHAWIGKSMFNTGPSPDPYLDGAIDDLRISCTAYTAEQIAALAD